MNVPAKDASTLIILRTGAGGLEVLLALRTSRSAFVPGSYVFPGGRVDDADRAGHMGRLVNALDREELNRVIEGPDDDSRALGIWVAAIRETFEEVGLLLASPRGEPRLVSFDSPETRKRYQAYRDHLRGHRITLREILERENLTLALDRLHFFSHWITPVFFSIRYDTRFFVTALPPGQEACHDGDEVTNHLWITPRAALEGYLSGRLHMVVPTIATLEELCRYETVDRAVASARDKAVSSILTRVVLEGDEIQEHAPDGRIFRSLANPKGGVS